MRKRENHTFSIASKAYIAPYPGANGGNRLSAKSIGKWIYAELEKDHDLKINYISSLTAKVFSLTKVIKLDATYEIAKIVNSVKSKMFSNCLNILNEYGQVIGYYLMTSESLQEARPMFDDVTKRLIKIRRRCPDVNLVYTDQCCSDAKFLKSVLGSNVIVKCDAFHVLQRLGRALPKKDPLFPVVMKAFSSAYFIDDEEDVTNLKSYLLRKDANLSLSNDDVKKHFRNKSKIRRKIPAPSELVERFEAVKLMIAEVAPHFLTANFLNVFKSQVRFSKIR